MRFKKYLLFLLLTLAAQHAFSQKKSAATDKSLVQFSGVVVTADSLQPLPYTSIIIKNTYRGTITDYFGFFSFVAKMGDTIEFAAIGYKRAEVVIPDTLTDQRCSMIQLLQRDTILLKEVVIFPWPTKEQFKEAFINLRVPDDDLARAEKNLDRNQINFLAATMAMDGSMNYKNFINQQSTRMYYTGQMPTTNLMNPVAWAKFIQAWQDGAFRRKDKKSTKTGDE